MYETLRLTEDRDFKAVTLERWIFAVVTESLFCKDYFPGVKVTPRERMISFCETTISLKLS